MKPFGVISDTHNHNWHAFSTTRADGLNSRLALILDEFERAASEVHAAGGDRVFHTGDLFHVRGKVAPSVFIPTQERIEALSKKYGVKWYFLAGNHDIEGKASSAIDNANHMLSGEHIRQDAKIALVNDEDGAHRFLLVPWIENLDNLRESIERCAEGLTRTAKTATTFLMIHAPIDGVIAGLPPHGLTASWLAQFGFKSVFCGHYHNAVEFPGNVHSSGAIAHHVWGDVGKKAGFWVVNEQSATHFESRAPKFVDVEGHWSDDELKRAIAGNYARAKVTTTKNADVEALREMLTKAGALGVTIQVVREPAQSRGPVATVKAGASLEESVGEFIKTQNYQEIDPAELTKECQLILAQASIKE